MQDFSCKVPENMNYELLAEKTKYFKQDDKGVSKMCKIMEDLRQEGRLEGRKEGRQEGKLLAYIDLIKSGLLTVKDAATKLGISEKELQQQIK